MKIDELGKELERQESESESEWDKAKEKMETAAKVFDIVETVASTYNEHRTSNPENWVQSRNSLLKRIDKGRKEGYLTEKQSVEMKNHINNGDISAIHEVALRHDKELETRKKQYLKKKGKRERLKAGFKSWKNGLKSMSKMEQISKSASAVASVLRAVDKFGAKNPDGSPNAIEIVSGVTDIANTVATFLPPPASAVTGTVSGILSMFGAGGPSTEEVVKEEFAKMKEFTLELFREQNKFISSKFEEQAELIRDQTAKIISYMDQQTRTIISKIFDSTAEIKSYIESFKDFIIKEGIKTLKDEVNALHTTVDKHLVSINETRYEIINDATAHLLVSFWGTFKEDKFEKVKEMFISTCLESKALQLPYYSIIENRLCTNILYTILVINTKRETLLNSLILMLSQSPTYRVAVKIYRGNAAKDKENMKTWLHDNIVTKDALMCPLFVTNKANWNSPFIRQSTLSFMKKIDHSLAGNMNELTFSYCENGLEKIVKDHCRCNQEGSTSIYCDFNGKCKCQEHYGRDKCDQRQCILEVDGGVRTSIKITSTWWETTIKVWGSSSCTLRILAVGAGGCE